MIKSKFKRVTSLFLATLMCVTTFAGIGSTTAYAASGEKADVYMVDFPRDGDANYDGVWGHSNLTLKNGWHTGRSNFTNLKAIGSYSGNVAYCIEPGISLKVGQTMNTQYPAHVLRYYPYGRAFTAGGNQAIVEVALTQLGNQGGQPYWSWYGFNSRVEWCACFVSWCADQCGYIESGLVPKFAGCVDGANWFKSNGKWQDRTYEPKVGDIIFFDWKGDGTTDHVGIVEKCENGTVYTVEGNSGDACKQRQYAVGSSNIYGYGIPAY